MESARNNPTKRFCCGSITATIWITPQVNGDKVVDVPSIKIDRSYLINGQRTYTASYFAEDLPKVALVATEAFRYLKLRSVEPDGHQQQEEQQDGNN